MVTNIIALGSEGQPIFMEKMDDLQAELRAQGVGAKRGSFPRSPEP
jgi:hypothetical protein